MSTAVLVLMIFGCAFYSWNRKARAGFVREPWHHTVRALLWSVWLLIRRD